MIKKKKRSRLTLEIFASILFIVTICIGVAYIISNNGSNKYKDVIWNTQVNYTAGDCDSSNYTAWCPHNLQYDQTRNRFVFLQCHASGHSGEFSPMTLCYLNPEDPLEYEEINCPLYNGVGALLILEDGTWYIWTDTMRYSSGNAGISWEEKELNTPLAARYGIYEIGDKLYAGDDSEEAGIYRVSEDGGISWEVKNFGVQYNDCEAAFCEFKGEVYAFLRTSTTEYACILKETQEGWITVNDDMLLAGNSNCSPVAFDDYIAIAHINRLDCHLYYTVWDGKDDFETTDLGLIEADTNMQGDFHSPVLAFGKDYCAIAFMMHTYGTPVTGSYILAQNNWLIGAYEDDAEFIKCNIENAYNINPESAESSARINGLSQIYPLNAKVFQDSISLGLMRNEGVAGVSMYNPDDSLSNYSVASIDGFLVPVYEGALIAYGTASGKVNPEYITPMYLYQYQPYCNITYKGKNYMCITSQRNSFNMMISMQRKNYLYKSSIITDCVITDEVRKVCYISPNSSCAMTGILQYAEIERVSANNDI